ncbi:uncharacterized protein LOC108464979 [Gossypium arboreum]|uniref:uncharacterized protein LOC108464979 n=1 Tax=Gossypium arboreum TaxID=29729 RepID=UPI00081910D0|nr:uncharacterized protein LOC108464979 [Gossypium arboreum]
MDPDRAVADDVESNAPAPAQGMVPEESRPVTVFDELSYTLEECLKCAISLLRDDAYHWWKTLILVVPKEAVTWDVFQEEFWKKYISERFIDKKCKEFLELRQGRMSVTKYEQEFVRLSKYVRECVPSKAKMCRRFEDGLNEDIRVLVGILELKEFFVLVERACKAKELTREKKKAESNARDMRKRMMNKSAPTQSKKSKDVYSRSYPSAGRLHGNRKK